MPTKLIKPRRGTRKRQGRGSSRPTLTTPAPDPPPVAMFRDQPLKRGAPAAMWEACSEAEAYRLYELGFEIAPVSEVVLRGQFAR